MKFNTVSRSKVIEGLPYSRGNFVIESQENQLEVTIVEGIVRNANKI